MAYLKRIFLIAKQNCKNNPEPWKLQRPPYKDVKNLLQNYTFEIYVEYEEGLTEVSDVVDQLLKEVRKLLFQDVQMARENMQKKVNCQELIQKDCIKNLNALFLI